MQLRIHLFLVPLGSSFLLHVPHPGQHRCSLVVRAAEDDGIRDLYKTVAEQDPEWYQEFVTNILQEDDLEDRNPSNGVVHEDAHDRVNEDVSSNYNPAISDTRNKSQKKDSTNDVIVPAVQSDGRRAKSDPDTTLHTWIDEKVVRDDPVEAKETVDDEAIEVNNSETADNEVDEVVNQESEGILSHQELDSMVKNTVQALEVEAKNEPTTETQPADDIAIDDQPASVIVYRDLYTGSLLAAPLNVLTRLGYARDEVPYLQPDALSLILEDEIAKPRRGIPLQWKVSPSQKKILKDDIRIVTKDEAREILESASKNKKQQVSRISKPDNEDLDKKTRRPAPRRQAFEERQRGRQVRDRVQQEKKARPTGIPTDGRTRGDPRGDPPPPISPVWMDINTFRDLLRKEAELRVRILGDDWKDTVKRESKWRLDLYKEWLWSLSDGVGEPIIESRVPPAYREPIAQRRPNPRSRDAPRPGSRDTRRPSSREPPRPRRRRRRDPTRDDVDREIMDPRRRRASRASRSASAPRRQRPE